LKVANWDWSRYSLGTSKRKAAAEQRFGRGLLGNKGKLNVGKRVLVKVKYRADSRNFVNAKRRRILVACELGSIIDDDEEPLVINAGR